MNRVRSTNLAEITPDRLPPAEAAGPARVLFLTTGILGFPTLSGMYQEYAGQRQDIDAVHVLIKPTLWMKAFAKSLGGRLRGWDQHGFRYMLACEAVVKRWLAGPLHHSRFDLIHLTTQGLGAGVVGVKRRYGLAYSVGVDATGVQHHRDFGYPRAPMAPYIAAERRIFAGAELVMGMTQWATDSVVADYGVPAERTFCCRGLRLPPPAGVPRPSEHGGPLRIAFVGNDWVRKRGPRLLEWHQRLWKDRAELHIFSSHAPRDTPLPSVVFHGPTPRQKLLTELLPSCDLFVLPTREDTLVWAALEASSQGLPVVSTRLAGLREVVIDGETGLLCPRDDENAYISAVERLMNDAALRRRMGEAGVRHVATIWDADRNYGGLMDRLVQAALTARAGRTGRTHPAAPAAAEATA